MHNKPRPSRIECESQGTFFTAFAMNLQTVIFFLDDMISFPTSELFLMAPTAPSCHRQWLLSPQRIWLISFPLVQKKSGTGLAGLPLGTISSCQNLVILKRPNPELGEAVRRRRAVENTAFCLGARGQGCVPSLNIHGSHHSLTDFTNWVIKFLVTELDCLTHL